MGEILKEHILERFYGFEILITPYIISHLKLASILTRWNYKLEFDSVRDMFKYIKQSGVSGSRSVLDYKQTKKLMNEYPVSYLEFEVVFITSR